MIIVNGISYVNLMTKNKMNNFIYRFEKNIVPKILFNLPKTQTMYLLANITDHNQSMQANEMCLMWCMVCVALSHIFSTNCH